MCSGNSKKDNLKKVLLITYYWPPAGGPGVQRWLKFVKYLPEFDVLPIVYTPENPTYPLLDESLSSEIPESIEVIKQPINEPYSIAAKFSKKSKVISKGIIPSKERQTIKERLLLFIRGNFFIPDARKNWVKPSVAYLSKYIAEHKIDTIITTGPPHSLHLIGLKLKQELNVKWFADFRDPWTTIGYHKKLKLLPFAKLKHKALEKKVLKTADHIIVTSFVTKNQFELMTSKPITVITNGYDHETTEPVTVDKRFTISHIGSLLSDRNPKVLWEALEHLVREDNTFQSLLQINLIGTVSKEILLSLEEHNLTQFLNLKGYVSHDKAINYQRKSQVLLLVEIDSDDTKCIIPGKLFEYLISKRPILAIGPSDSDVEQVLFETKAGIYHTHSELANIKSTLMSYFKAFRNNMLESNAIDLDQFSRKALTKTLAQLIHHKK